MGEGYFLVLIRIEFGNSGTEQNVLILQNLSMIFPHAAIKDLVADKSERTHEIQATGSTCDKAARRN